jgi:nucleotide-binding universal stress UspA family protein
MDRAPAHILVPVDGSDDALDAVELAGVMARALGADLLLMHVVDEGATGGTALANLDEALRQARVEELARPVLDAAWARLGRLREELAAGELVVLGDSPPAEIRKAVVERGIELLVMSHTRHAALTELFFGSTSRELLDRAPCPILLVP